MVGPPPGPPFGLRVRPTPKAFILFLDFALGRGSPRAMGWPKPPSGQTVALGVIAISKNKNNYIRLFFIYFLNIKKCFIIF